VTTGKEEGWDGRGSQGRGGCETPGGLSV
jgi:hypothetical protein